MYAIYCRITREFISTGHETLTDAIDTAQELQGMGWDTHTSIIDLETLEIVRISLVY